MSVRSYCRFYMCTVCLDKGDAVCDIVMPDDWSIRSMRIDGAEVSVRESAVPGKQVEFTAVRKSDCSVASAGDA